MTLGERIAVVFQLDENAWHRHANPWSVWTRTTVLPVLILVAWSRVWLGWGALGPGVLALLWMWLNPRVFGPPEHMDHWASKAVLGERVWIHRDETPVPARHRLVPHVLNVVSGIGMLVVLWGVVCLSIWPTLLGAVLVYAGKLWFLDRMVWLYEDVEGENIESHQEGKSPR